MPSTTKPVEDTVPQVNNEIAVGSDMDFQRKWWRFTRTLWICFAAVIVADVLGCFGRGPVANATAKTNDRTMEVKYERIERYGAPSILRIEFGPAAVHDGAVKLWVSESVIKSLGAQRVIPQPDKSVVGQDGITYTFPVSGLPASVKFALQPAAPGLYKIRFQVPGYQPLQLGVFVMP